MSTLVAIGYDDPYKAEEVRLKLWKMQRDYLIDLGDAVVAVKVLPSDPPPEPKPAS